MKKHNDQKLEDVLKDLYNSRRLKPKLDLMKIKTAWKELMGPNINKYTNSISLNKGKLFVKIDSAPLKHELNFGKEKIIKMMNKELGDDVITQVIFR